MKNGKRYTLKDLKLKIRYIKNYILTPLLELIKSSSAYKNKQRTVVYLESQINNLNEQIDILQEKKDNYEKFTFGTLYFYT